jgi:perosamine synthetase
MTSIEIPWWNTAVSESTVELVGDAFRNRNISQGVLTAKFEQALAERLGVPHVVCTTSGTMALTMAFMALGIGPGDEIVMPNRTWVATANAALLLGTQIHLVDSAPGDYIIDPERIEAEIGPNTKAIVPVSLNGKAVAIDRINEIAARHGVAVVEDACQALFSRMSDGRAMGTSSRFGCYSLGMAKTLTTAAGGVVVCRDENDARLLRRIRNQGMSDYDLSERHNVRGGNFKFTDIQAAIGLGQLTTIDERIERQKAIQRLYTEGLADLDFLSMVPVNVGAGEVPMRTEILVENPPAVRAALLEYGIASSLQAPNLADFPFIGADPGLFPVSMPYATRILVLPCGPDQPLENVKKTIEVMHKLASRFVSR